MRQKVSGTYTRAGTARRCGRGLALEIAGVQYYITPEDLPALMAERPADVVNDLGEQEGSAWLSPVVQQKKQELTALIQNRLYVLSLRDLSRLQLGIRSIAKIHEYNHG